MCISRIVLCIFSSFTLQESGKLKFLFFNVGQKFFATCNKYISRGFSELLSYLFSMNRTESPGPASSAGAVEHLQKFIA